VLEKEKEEIQRALSPYTVEAVLITTLDDHTTVATAPQIRGSLWDPYLVSFGADPTSMGFYRSSGDLRTMVRLRSSLYRVQDGALVWVGYTDTILKESTDVVNRIRSVVHKIVSRMAKDDQIL
jgi:hypothetical protein